MSDESADATRGRGAVKFVFAMIFGHAPIVFPAVLGLPVPVRPVFSVHLASIELSILLRLVGDVPAVVLLRQWGGLLNAIAILFFLANAVRSVGVQSRAARSAPVRPATVTP